MEQLRQRFGSQELAIGAVNCLESRELEDCNIFEPGASYRRKPDAPLGPRVMAR